MSEWAGAVGRCSSLLYLPGSFVARCQIEGEHVEHRWEHDSVESMVAKNGKPQFPKAKAVLTWRAP